MRQRAVAASGVTAPVMGQGDPTLKSGASPTSIQQLIAQADQRFGLVDKNLRAGLSTMYMFVLELIQQYAPADGISYQVLSSESAAAFEKLFYLPPTGPLRRIFRLSAKAPTAATNKEMHKMTMLVLYDRAVQHATTVMQLQAQGVAASNPAAFARIAEELATMLNELMRQIVKLHNVPVASVPLPQLEPTDQDALISQLQQQLAQMSEQLAQFQEAANAVPQPMGGDSQGSPDQGVSPFAGAGAARAPMEGQVA